MYFSLTQRDLYVVINETPQALSYSSQGNKMFPFNSYRPGRKKPSFTAYD
jgi:hypothetical protein